MSNEELINALRCEKDCKDCSYWQDAWSHCDEWGMRCDAADALEAAEKRIAELQEPIEKQIVDYCHKRCLVIVSKELLQRMESTMNQWIPCNERLPDPSQKEIERCVAPKRA